jgi:uncharacterized protein (TIGR03435 family)
LEWAPDSPLVRFTSTGTDIGAPRMPDDGGATIFVALQPQLGLRLRPTKGPVDVIVIDHVERPSEN